MARSMMDNFKLPNPFSRRTVTIQEPKMEAEAKAEEGNQEGNQEDGRSKEASTSSKRASQILESIRVPLVGLFGKKNRDSKAEDVESGGGGEAATELLDKKEDELDAILGSKEKEEVLRKQAELFKEHEGIMAKDLEFNMQEKKDPDESSQHSREKTDPEKASTMEATYTTGPQDAGMVKEDWRMRLANLPKKTVAIGLTLALLLLLVIVVICAVLGSRKSGRFDSSVRIVRGKFVESITSCGRVQGLVEDGAFAFRGIPYAVPPVGKNRWKYARSQSSVSECWNGTLVAHNASFPCWQYYPNGSYDGVEDCLTLDVFTPKVVYDAPLPVVVMIGGLSLNGGESSWLRPSAKLAREKGVVWVQVQVRRGVLGFLALELLARTSRRYTSGNYGVSDLIAALAWVQRDIVHFGGDPESVTLLGHQSGATLATALTASRPARGLFQRAWLTSGSGGYTNLTIKDSERNNVAFLNSVECNLVECLYEKSPEELLEGVPYEWRTFSQNLPVKGEDRHVWSVKDMYLLQDAPMTVWENGNFNDIPIMFGATAQAEASGELLHFLDWNKTETVVSYMMNKLEHFSKELVREALAEYKHEPGSSMWHQFSSMVTDIRTLCPIRRMAAKADEHFKHPVMFYVATQQRKGPLGNLAEPSADMMAILNLYQPKTKEEKAFVGHMQKMFYQFISGTTPVRGPDLRHPTASRNIMMVDHEVQTARSYPNCDFWEKKGIVPQYARVD